jgi:polar amino acid transport system substrate-binding protein
MKDVLLSRRVLLAATGASLLVPPLRAAAQPVTIEKIKRAGVLRVGCEAAYVPFTYRDNTAAIVGFDVEIVARYLEPLCVKA